MVYVQSPVPLESFDLFACTRGAGASNVGAHSHTDGALLARFIFEGFSMKTSLLQVTLLVRVVFFDWTSALPVFPPASAKIRAIP